MVPDSIPVERMARVGAPERKLYRYPGLKEEYYLSDFEPDPSVLGALGIDAERRDRRRAPAAGDLRVPRPERPPPAPARPARPAEGTVSVVIPRTEGQAEAVRAIGSSRLIVPGAGDRRPEPDRPRRPGGQRRRHDEPRGGGPRDARLHHVRRAHGGRRREADRRGKAGDSRGPGRSSRSRSAGGRPPSGCAATPSCWCAESSGPSDSLISRPSASGPHRGLTKWHRQPTPSSPSSSPPRSPGCWSRRPRGWRGGSGRSTIPATGACTTPRRRSSRAWRSSSPSRSPGGSGFQATARRARSCSARPR